MEKGATKVSWWSFDNLALIALSLGLFLLPIFNLSFLGLSVEISKSLLLTGSAFLALILWLLGRLQEGHLILPKNYIIAGAGVIVLVSLLSAIFSGSFWNSFSGLGFELDTVFSLFVSLVLLFLIGVYFQSRPRFLSAYIGIFAVALIFFIFNLISFFVLKVDWLSFARPFWEAIGGSMSVSLIGKWYDFGVYAGFILLSSLVMLEFFSLKQMPVFRAFIVACFFLALISLIFINYLPIWIFVGLASLVLFVYKISFWGLDLSKETSASNSKFLVPRVFLPSFIVIIVALLFVVLGGPDKLGGQLNNFRNRLIVPIVEVKPSWSGTWVTSAPVLKSDPILGLGPNRFAEAWVKYKPQAVNQTSFWSTDFRFGIGFWPSQLVSVGLLGLIAWLLFFASIIYYGVRFIFTTSQDKSTRALLLLSFLGSVYLWTFSIIFVPDRGLFALAFIVTGLFVAILTDTKIIKNKDVPLTEDPRLSFVSILVFVVLIIGSIVLGYLSLQKYLSLYAFQQGQKALAAGELDTARSRLAWASNLSRQDVFFRYLAEADIALAGKIINDKSLSKEEIRLRFLSQIDSAIKNALTATKLNSTNYLNWLSLGRVYEALVPLGIDQSYEESQKAFKKAQELNPSSPAILVDYFARLEINKKNIYKAKDYVNQALKMKNNYSQAVSLLSQIDIEEGNTDIATRRLEQFVAAYPQDALAGLYFQLGYLKYQAGLYNQAVSALGRATAQVPNYSNAKYFLGLSLKALGRREEALQQFKDIARSNQGNEEINYLISSLELGEVYQPEPEATTTATTTKKK